MFWEMGQAQVPAFHVQRWEFWVSPQELPVHPWDGIPGMKPTTMSGRPRAALMKALRPVRPEHFGSLQPVASTHPSFGGNTPVMSFLSPQPSYKHFWHE